jgi:hypothetical protein
MTEMRRRGQVATQDRIQPLTWAWRLGELAQAPSAIPVGVARHPSFSTRRNIFQRFFTEFLSVRRRVCHAVLDNFMEMSMHSKLLIRTSAAVIAITASSFGLAAGPAGAGMGTGVNAGVSAGMPHSPAGASVGADARTRIDADTDSASNSAAKARARTRTQTETEGSENAKSAARISEQGEANTNGVNAAVKEQGTARAQEREQMRNQQVPTPPASPLPPTR